MPLLLGAYLQACNERQRWGQGGGGRGTKRHAAAALVHSLAAAEHRLGSHINLQGTGRLPHRVPRGCWVLPRQLLTAPQPPSPSRQPSRVAPPAAPQAPRRAWRRPRSRVGLRGGTGRLPIAGAKLTSRRGVTALRGLCSDVGIARRVRGRRDSTAKGAFWLTMHSPLLTRAGRVLPCSGDCQTIGGIELLSDLLKHPAASPTFGRHRLPAPHKEPAASDASLTNGMAA